MIECMGTTMGNIGYTVKYLSSTGINYGDSIDHLLKVWNKSLSTYIPDSEISRFNRGTDCFRFESTYFLPVIRMAGEVFEKTNGAFDPTVGPLVNAWGFGPDKSMTPDSTRVDSLKAFVGYQKITFNDTMVCKSTPGVQLDFSAIAKGYAVDVVTEFLAQRGIKSSLVEIGGEVVCKGTKLKGEPWRTAIEDPTVAIYERRTLAVANLIDKAVATSGNYRNYYVRDGKTYAHSIDPSTGYPTMHELLSSSVFAENCMKADAYATAFMVMGVEKSMEILENDATLDAFLIYRGDNGEILTYVTPGIAGQIEKIEE